MPYCTLTGIVKNATGGFLNGSIVSARPRVPGNVPVFVDGALLSDDLIETATDGNGHFQLVLAQGVKYVVVIEDANYRRAFTIPAVTSIDLKDI